MTPTWIITAVTLMTMMLRFGVPTSPATTTPCGVIALSCTSLNERRPRRHKPRQQAPPQVIRDAARIVIVWPQDGWQVGCDCRPASHLFGVTA
jgi:hypothetical protein